MTQNKDSFGENLSINKFVDNQSISQHLNHNYLFDICLRLLTKKGKQSKAQKILKKTLTRIQVYQSEQEMNGGRSRFESNTLKEINGESSHLKQSAFAFFQTAIDNIKPYFELKKLRLSGITHQIPAVLSPLRQEKKALRWLVQTAALKKRKKNLSYGFDFFFASELIDAYKKQGELRSKRDEIHKIAELNKGLSHHRWWS